MCSIDDTIRELEEEITAIDVKLKSLLSGNHEMNARTMQLCCMRGDMCRQLQAARMAQSRARPPDDGGGD